MVMKKPIYFKRMLRFSLFLPATFRSDDQDESSSTIGFIGTFKVTGTVNDHSQSGIITTVAHYKLDDAMHNTDNFNGSKLSVIVIITGNKAN